MGRGRRRLADRPLPAGLDDWNDRFRDTVRDFWLADQAAAASGGQGGTVARLASCLAGSTELFAGSGRTALASLNFVTAHDGFTLADLTSYHANTTRRTAKITATATTTTAATTTASRVIPGTAGSWMRASGRHAT